MVLTGRPGVTAIVVARDEALHLASCLRTLRWAGETLVVVDTRSRDETAALAEQLGAHVRFRDWEGWAAQRNYGATAAAHDWVFFLDADERVPPELAEEIQRAVATADRDGVVGFWVPRQNLIMGRWMRHAGWWPDAQMRLYRRGRGGYDPQRPVHELVLLDGPTRELTHPLVHHNYVSWRQFWSKQRQYAAAEALAMSVRGARARPRNLVLQPLREFRRRYWTLHGYRAGGLGLALSALLAAANFVMYVDLWRAGRRSGGGASP